MQKKKTYSGECQRRRPVGSCRGGGAPKKRWKIVYRHEKVFSFVAGLFIFQFFPCVCVCVEGGSVHCVCVCVVCFEF